MPQYQGIWTLAQAAQLQSTQRWATDPLFENTTLLLQADNAVNGAQNNTFLDSSSNNFTITRNGNTTQGTFTPFSQSPGWWGNYFDGTGDFLTAVGANLALGTGDFTIEFWFYAAAYSSAVDSSFMFDSRSGNNTTGFFIGPVFNNTQTLHVGQNASPIITANTTYPLNTWIHCAVVRSSGTITLYQNGISVGSVANTTNNTATTNYIASGYWQPSGSGQMFNGYLSNLRISNVARYTANFNPPTNIFVSDGNTRLLTCQANRFLDSSSNAYTVTSYGTPSVQAFSPFAPQYQYTPSVTGGSGYFNGGATTALTVSSATAFDFGTGDFTVECWAYVTAQTGTFTLLCATEGVNQYWGFGDAGSGLIGMTMYAGTSGTDIYSGLSGNPPLNQWNYLVWQRSSGVASMYLNGTRVYNAAYTVDFGSSATGFRIGQSNNYANYYTTGYISNLRVVKGSGVYSGATITVPTAPLTNIANTSLLLNFTNAGIVDGTMKNNLETVGNAQISTSVVKYGTGSMAFDGTGDYLRIQPSDLLATWFNSDYTIEYWVYPNAFASSANGGSNVYSQSDPASTSEYFSFGPRASGVVVWYYYNGAVQVVTSGTISTGVWTHLAWTYQKSSNTMRIFINGVLNTTTTIAGTPSISTTANPILVGASTTVGFNGYIDDLRVTKGIARYTANFTPPTVALPRQ